MARIAGTIEMTINGDVLAIASEGIDYDLGKPKREPLSGPDKALHGHKEQAKSPYISGTGRVVQGFSVGDLCDLTDVTIQVKLANGTTLGFYEAFYDGDGVANSGNAEIPFHFTAARADEILP